MQEAGHRDTDAGEDLCGLVINLQGLFADVERAHRQHTVDIEPQHVPEPFLTLEFVNLLNEEPAVNKPDFADDNQAIGRENDTECGDRRREVRCEQRFHCARRLLQVQQQRQTGRG